MRPIEINNKTVLREQRRAVLKNDRRKISEGYPAEPFTDVDSIRRYLSQERIDCLICGRCLKSLSTHLAKIHRISSDDYKSRFGLPFGVGLTSVSTRAKLRNVRERDSAEVRTARLKMIRESAAESRAEAARNQRKSAIKPLLCKKNIVSINDMVRKKTAELGRHPNTRHSVDDARLIVEKLEAGALLKNVITMAPSTLRKILDTDLELLKRYRSASCTARNQLNRARFQKFSRDRVKRS